MIFGIQILRKVVHKQSHDFKANISQIEAIPVILSPFFKEVSK